MKTRAGVKRVGLKCRANLKLSHGAGHFRLVLCILEV